MIFESVSAGGCRSYLIGCEETCAAALIASRSSARSRSLQLAPGRTARPALPLPHRHAYSRRSFLGDATAGAPAQRACGDASCESGAVCVDLRLEGGELLVIGNLRLQALHTPGHTRDSMCLCVEDRVFTGDTLLIGATGRTDLPSGDAGALYESLFQGLLKSPRSVAEKYFPRSRI